MTRSPATLSMSVLSLLLAAAWTTTLAPVADGYAYALRLAVALVLLPTVVGYGVYFLQDAGVLRIRLDSLSRGSSWLVLGVASLIALNQLGLVGRGDFDLAMLGNGAMKLLLSVFFWASLLAFMFKRTRVLAQRRGDGMLAAIFAGVICIHNLPEGLTLGLSLSDTQAGSADSGVIAALAMQNVVDAIIAGAVVLTKRIPLAHKTAYLVALPVVEVLCAAAGLHRAVPIDRLADDALMFAAGGMLAIALTDILLRRHAPSHSNTEHA